MVTKVKKSASQAQPNIKTDLKASLKNIKSMNPAAVAESVKASAQQIYLAGLAQFAKAQQEGGKVFESLVKEGLAIQKRTQAMAEERLNEVANKASGMASEVAAKASGHWNKLEDIFEERVARALNKMGVPSAKDISALIARIDALASQVKQGATKPARAAAKTVKAKAIAPAKKAARSAKIKV